MLNEEEYWFWMSCIEGIGPVTIFTLLRFFSEQDKDSPENAQQTPSASRRLFTASPEEIMGCPGISEKKCCRIISGRNEEKIHESYTRMLCSGIRFVPYVSDEYPQILRELHDPPVGLYVIGNLPSPGEWILSVVGARTCTEYGREIAKSIARGLALTGISIVSGMARGIDTASHYGCLEGGGKTYAILGCGPDICYPADNINVYEEILEGGGGILSEYPPGTRPAGWHFPVRNRIIAGLAKGIVVVEARKRSGSLITAQIGLELGRNIYAVPGRARDNVSQGCNELIRAGAQLVTSSDEILEDFGFEAREYKKKQVQGGKTLHKVYACLSLVPSTADDIAIKSGLSIVKIVQALTLLELQGLIREVGKNQYILCL